jgi:hypothetical protein
VHFESQHDFTASRERVAATLCDPDFQAGLELPDLSRPEVIESTTDGATRVLRLRYEYVGQLDPIARKVVGSRKLTWLQELRLDTNTYDGTLTFAAEADEDRLNGTARVSITRVDTDRARRSITGDFHVKVPLIGGTAERRIVPGLKRRLDAEAEALAMALHSQT